MKSVNNAVQLIGHLARDVEIREFSSGTKMARVTLATNDLYKNARGQMVADTQWHNVVAWGKTAERMSRLLAKGSQVAIKGKLVHRTYEDKNGNMRYTSEVSVIDFSKVD